MFKRAAGIRGYEEIALSRRVGRARVGGHAGAADRGGGGAAILIGAFVPLASLGLLCTMAVAASYHIKAGDPFVSQGKGFWELAAVYFAISLLLLLAGPGIFSVDKVAFGRRSTPA